MNATLTKYIKNETKQFEELSRILVSVNKLIKKKKTTTTKTKQLIKV
jgi:hypothetical protein